VIVVVGAGPAGLASAAALGRSGESVVVLERGEVAAAWSGRYDRLQLHTVRWLSGLPGYRIPRSYGKWPSRDRVIEYLRGYADRNAIDVRKGIEVERIDRDGGGWVLETSGGSFQAERVVVATGNNNVAFVPDWPGSFAGRIVHSSEYRNAEPYRGRRVLVAGGGNSGAEIAVDLADGGPTEVLLSVRTPPSIVRRDVLGFPSQVLGIVSMHLPVTVVDHVAATMRRLAFPDLGRYGLTAPARPYSEFLRRRVIPIVDVGLADAVRSGRVRVVSAVTGVDGEAVILADGARRQVDDVIAATGFRTGLEPLVGHLGVLDEHGRPLVHAADQHPAAPGLHFVGYQVTLGGTFRLVGVEAKRITRAVVTRAPFQPVERRAVRR
jgi:putative flavoprotein involved in K+ transport